MAACTGGAADNHRGRDVDGQLGKGENMTRPVILLLALAAASVGWGETQLRMSLRSEPRPFDPLLVEDDASELIRYMTAGVLVRVDRITQELRSELATSWKLSRDAKQL